jgi:uncharacterized protein (TIGR02757 family)
MYTMDHEGLKGFLDRKVDEYNQPSFILFDPVSIPHRFQKQQDIEIAGFFAAIFSWGNRTTIIQKSMELLRLMEDEPYEFIRSHREKDLKRFLSFKHRTFTPPDLFHFFRILQYHYRENRSLEDAFLPKDIRPETGIFIESALNHFHHYFFSLEDSPARTRKHIAAPEKKSTCKRLNMFLRWMVRQDNHGVDFGIWKKIVPSQLVCPIDLHVARVAKRFGLLKRRQVDWVAALELTAHLRTLDKQDPVKYDFALFGLGVMEHF